MKIDIPTLVIATGVSHFVQFLVFFHQYRVNKNSGVGWWVLWTIAEAIGFVFILLRTVPSFSSFAISMQNIVIISGTFFVYIGTMRFLGRKVDFRYILFFILSFSILHLFFYWIIDDIHIRTILITFALSILSFVNAIRIYQYKTKSISFAADFNVVTFIIHGSVFIYRSITIILYKPEIDILEYTFFNLIQYFDAFIIGLLWTFGFIIMLNQELYSEISEAKTHFEQIFNTSPDAASITRMEDGLFIDCNESYSIIFGYAKKEIIGKSIIDINIWNDLNDRKKALNLLIEKGYCDNFEASFRKKDGTLIAGLISIKMITLKDVPHLISVTKDITERIKANEALKEAKKKVERYARVLYRLAILDGLTKVANRRRFDDTFLVEWNRHLREQKPITLVLIDIDYFKNYNDHYGHQKGDDCLVKVAEAISKMVKRYSDLVARYGGEEFVVILSNTGIQGGSSVAESILDEVRSLKILHERSEVSSYITLSLGVASVIPTKELQKEGLIANADKALYTAKQNGRNQVVVYDSIF